MISILKSTPYKAILLRTTMGNYLYNKTNLTPNLMALSYKLNQAKTCNGISS